MTAFLALADHFGSAIHIIGTAVALFFIALIATEAALRPSRRRHTEAVFNERKDKFVHRLNRRAF
jgi:hypothetical protein